MIPGQDVQRQRHDGRFAGIKRRRLSPPLAELARRRRRAGQPARQGPSQIQLSMGGSLSHAKARRPRKAILSFISALCPRLHARANDEDKQMPRLRHCHLEPHAHSASKERGLLHPVKCLLKKALIAERAESCLRFGDPFALERFWSDDQVQRRRRKRPEKAGWRACKLQFRQ